MLEIGVILVVALIILGPKQLMEVARVAGRLYRDLQRMWWDVRNTVDLESHLSPGSFSEPSHDTAPKPDKKTVSQPQDEGDNDWMPPKEERHGPDFYADMLEQSRKDSDETAEPNQQTSTESSESPQTSESSDTDKTADDTVPDSHDPKGEKS